MTHITIDNYQGELGQTMTHITTDSYQGEWGQKTLTRITGNNL